MSFAARLRGLLPLALRLPWKDQGPILKVVDRELVCAPAALHVVQCQRACPSGTPNRRDRVRPRHHNSEQTDSGSKKNNDQRLHVKCPFRLKFKKLLFRKLLQQSISAKRDGLV